MSDWSRIDEEDFAQGEVKPGVRVELALTDEAQAGLVGLVVTELEDLQDGRAHWQASTYAGPSDGRGRVEDGSVWYEQLRQIYRKLTGEEWRDPFADPS